MTHLRRGCWLASINTNSSGDLNDMEIDFGKEYVIYSKCDQ